MSAWVDGICGITVVSPRMCLTSFPSTNKHWSCRGRRDLFASWVLGVCWSGSGSTVMSKLLGDGVRATHSTSLRSSQLPWPCSVCSLLSDAQEMSVLTVNCLNSAIPVLATADQQSWMHSKEQHAPQLSCPFR